MQPTYRKDQGWRNRAIFGALGLRRPQAEHTAGEGAALRRAATGASHPVEIGVAEGGSAWEIRSVMAADACLTLIDPYHLSNLGELAPARRIAHRLVDSVPRGTVRWIEEFSHDAISLWSGPIDFLFIDGDHSFEGVRRDWSDWSVHLVDDARVAFHDADPSASWITPEDGPARLVTSLLDSGAWRRVDGADSLVVLGRAP